MRLAAAIGLAGAKPVELIKIDAQGLDVSFAGFLAVILGAFIPVVFLVTLFIQSDAQGTATSFRQPDSNGGTRYEDE